MYKIYCCCCWGGGKVKIVVLAQYSEEKSSTKLCCKIVGKCEKIIGFPDFVLEMLVNVELKLKKSGKFCGNTIFSDFPGNFFTKSNNC